MANDTENSWLGNLERQAGVRRAVLLHGDVLDVSYCKETQDYRPVTEVVTHALKRRGFDHIILWDRFSGVDCTVTPVGLWDRLAREATLGASTGTGAGSDYDVGPPSKVDAAAPGVAPPNADDFLSVVYHHMLRPCRERYAFILDWSQYLFGNANALSEQERQWLLVLSKAIRNAPLPLDDLDSLKRPSNIVILLCTKLTGIPPGLYQGNPAVQEVIVPGPGRPERELFIRRTNEKWRLRATPRPGELSFSDFVDALEGLSIRDLQQLIKLSRQTSGDPPTFERLINLYKYGEQKSPWEDLSRDKLATIRECLKERVKGQDEAIEKVSSVIIRAYTGLSGLQHSKKQKMPKGMLFTCRATNQNSLVPGGWRIKENEGLKPLTG